jgi:hypothetical protein
MFVFFAATSIADQHEYRETAVILDEDLWVTFYDLPSRRFRAIRAAVLTRNIESASRDLVVTANYISVEAERAFVRFQEPLRDVVSQLLRMKDDIESVTLGDLDVLFGRTHWLLAQHYLQFAKVARDARQSRNASLYLLATTHHMERALLWSNVPVTRKVQTTFDDLRDVASRLQNSETSARAYNEKPFMRAEQLLRDIGKQVDRPVLLPKSQDVSGGAESR